MADVNPDLVVRDENGEVYTVRYEAVNAMLLNEFLKEHKIVEQQQATLAELRSMVAQQRKDFEAVATKQQEQIQAFAVGLQGVSVRLAAASPRGRTSGSLEMSEVVKGRVQQSRTTRRIAVNNP